MTTSKSKNLLAAVPIPLVLIGPDERVRIANNAATMLLGDSLTGRHYIAALRQPSVLDCIETAFDQGQQARAQYLSSQAQRDATFTLVATPIDLDDGAGVLVSFEDISPVEEAGQMRRDFVANVSHELRTPLTALLGYIETLQGPASDDPAAQTRFLESMQAEAGRMNRLIQDLLSLSRVEREERMRPTGSVDVLLLLEGTVNSLKSLAQTNSVDITVAAGAMPALVPGDADQLRQVFANLLENAIKYGAKPGRVEVTVASVDHEPMLRGPAIRIEVQDQGDGIDVLHLPRLTERFYRVDSHRSRQVGGTGLGLAIVKHIINRHRGRLRISSQPGQGSRFTVILPRAEG